MKSPLPGLVRWLISRFATGKDQEIIEGDFEEALAESNPHPFQYYHLIIKELFGLMRLSHLRRKRNNQPSGLGANLLKVIVRNLKRKWSYTLINVTGLSISLMVFALILAYVTHELSYDRYHQDHERVFRITYQEDAAELTNGHWARVPLDWVNKLPDYFPQVEQLVRFQSFRFRDIQVGDHAFREHYAFAVDPGVFETFDLEFLQGNPKEALNQPYSVVLTASTASKYFGDTNTLNETIKTVDAYGNLETYQVTGIIKDTPVNSHLPINLLTSINGADQRTGWAYIYVKLRRPQDAALLADQMNDFIATHSPDPETTAMFTLQPIADIHLHSHLAREITTNNQLSSILIFLGASLFLLIVAIINFANLNSAQSLGRSRELGVRKVLGGSRAHLKVYFFLESFLLFLGSLSIAIMGYIVLLPVLGQFMGQILQPDHFTMIVIACILLVVVPWVSSLYPSQGLVRLSVIQALKSQLQGDKKLPARKMLIAFQFGLAMALISAMHITQRQFHFLQNKQLGFEGGQIMAIRHIPDETRNEINVLREQLTKMPAVADVSAVMELPGNAVRDGIVLLKPGQEQDEGINVDIQIMEPNFPDMMEMEFSAGNMFADVPYAMFPEGSSGEEVIATISNRKRDYVINEAAARLLGFEHPAEAIGQRIRGYNLFYQLKEGPIVGVIKDYHQESLRASIDPVVMVHEPIWLGHLLVKLHGQDLFQSVAQVEEIWRAAYPGFPMDMVFLDQELNRLYEGERKQKELLQAFTLITLMVATLGLLGLMGYSLKIRQKELAVRKVLGADLIGLVKLLAKDYLLSLSIGVSLAIPLVWFTMNEWLQHYAYHTNISISSFAMGALLLAFLVLVPLMTQMIRNDRNPADVLKSE